MKYGGSIGLDSAGLVHLKENKFLRNKVTDELAPITDWRYCDAGVIYYQCYKGLPLGEEYDKKCDVRLEGNTFQGNSAKNKGGALRYVHKNFTTVYQDEDSGRVLLGRALQSHESHLVDTNSYVDNYAPYAPNIASIPADYKYKLVQNGKTFYSDDSYNHIVIAPGQVIDLTLFIYDNEGRLFSDENEAVCTIELVDKWKLPQGSQIVNPEAVSSSGQFIFNQLNIR